MKLSILFTILLFFQNHFLSNFATTTPKAYKNFITKSCSTTTYPSICNKCLSSYAEKVKNDPLKLYMAALTVSLQAAKNSSSTVSVIAKQKGISNRDKDVIRVCIYTIKDSVDKIKQSISALGSINKSTSKRFQLDSIKTYVSAAMTDEETCIDELDDSKLNTGAKKNIKSVVMNFKRITSNALSFINRLKY